MMLIIVDAPDLSSSKLIVCLPASLLSIYEGFVEIQPDALPSEATLLVGHQDLFEELFDYPARSRSTER
jgi:hypothetical protein